MASVTPITIGTDGLLQQVQSGDSVLTQDEYASGQTLQDQTAAGSVLTFTFSSPVQLVYVYGTSSGGTNLYRADPFGGTPSATQGIPCPDSVPTAIPIIATTVKVYGVSGTVSVWGFRY